MFVPGDLGSGRQNGPGVTPAKGATVAVSIWPEHGQLRVSSVFYRARPFTSVCFFLSYKGNGGLSLMGDEIRQGYARSAARR